MYTRVVGNRHPDTLASARNLASVYKYQGRWKDAEILLTKTLETQKEIFGQEHPTTLTAMIDLASIYLHLRQ
jgi:hypothetical protein